MASSVHSVTNFQVALVKRNLKKKREKKKKDKDKTGCNIELTKRSPILVKSQINLLVNSSGLRDQNPHACFFFFLLMTKRDARDIKA